MQDSHCSHIVKVYNAQHHKGLKLLKKEGQGPGPEESRTKIIHKIVKPKGKRG